MYYNNLRRQFNEKFKIIYAPVGFDEDDGYGIRDEFVFVTNSYEATLRVFDLRNPQKSFTMLDKEG